MHLQHLKVFILLVSILIVSELIIATHNFVYCYWKNTKLLIRSHQYLGTEALYFCKRRQMSLIDGINVVDSIV